MPLEEDAVLVALHEHGMQRPEEVLARADARRRDGADRVEHRARSDGKTGGPQRPAEIGDVLGKLAVRRLGLPRARKTRPFPARLPQQGDGLTGTHYSAALISLRT